MYTFVFAGCTASVWRSNEEFWCCSLLLGVQIVNYTYSNILLTSLLLEAVLLNLINLCGQGKNLRVPKVRHLYSCHAVSSQYKIYMQQKSSL